MEKEKADKKGKRSQIAHPDRGVVIHRTGSNI